MTPPIGPQTGSTRHSPITTPHPTLADNQRITDATEAATRRTVVTVARELGATVLIQPPGQAASTPDIEPLAGIRTAQEIECLAARIAVGYIRAARETGHSWHDIGCALNMQPGSMTGNMHESFADTAFSYASSHEPHPSLSDHYVTWDCANCDNTIKDYGPGNGRIADQHGHAQHCPRSHATIDIPGQRTPEATLGLVGSRPVTVIGRLRDLAQLAQAEIDADADLNADFSRYRPCEGPGPTEPPLKWRGPWSNYEKDHYCAREPEAGA